MSEYRASTEDGLRTRVGGPWTREKLTYLEKYAEAFAMAMAPKREQRLWERLVFIDPLCGPGIDSDRRTGEEFHGSPLIALHTEPRFDRIYLGDLDPENIRVLTERVPLVERERVKLDAVDCHERVTRIVGDMGSRTLGIAFVDPEAFEAHFELFQTLSRRAVDIVYLFPSGIGVVRNLAVWVQQEHCPLDDLWGNGDWRALPMARVAAGWTPDLSQLDAGIYRSWATAFCERMKVLGYNHYDVQGPLRNEQNTPMYHLIFLSKSEAGLTIWRGISQIDARRQRRLFK